MASRSGYQQQQWSVLKCPRCESSNTKFCYYNNYSLSQPRHFCKACKRYWTRGGTLRNVPVGGSCRRKNRLAKKPSCSVRSVVDGAPSSSVPTTVSFAINPQPDHIIETSSSSTLNRMNIPSFHGLPGNPYNIELPHALSSRSDSNLNVDTLLRFNHLNDLGGLPYTSGFTSTFPDVVSNSNPLLFSSTLTPLLLHPQKLINDSHSLQQVPNHFHSLLPFGNQLQTHQQGNGPYQTSNENDQISLSDPSLYLNSTTVTSVWHDPADFGFSDSSLI